MEDKVRVNLGAGKERLPGWLSLDVPPGENISMDGIEVTPDIIAMLPDLPFGDSSVDAYRARDLLVDYEAEGFDVNKLGEEIKRTLRPGGTLTTIEHHNWRNRFSRWLRLVSIEKDEKVSYRFGAHYWRTIYVKV